MKVSAILTGILLLFSAFALTLPEPADAARMGGGRSFGGKPFMSRWRPRRPCANRRPTRSASP